MQSKYLKLQYYKLFLLRRLARYLSPIISLWEKKFIIDYGQRPLKHQPVFIIGAPRTGSTILYQTLTNQLDVVYIDNLVSAFYKNIFFGFWLSHKLFRHRAHDCFESDHGETSAYGLRAPSECGAFWYRWLPRERHFIDYSDITDTMIAQIRQELTAVINFFNKPLVINNNNIALRIRLVSQVFPEAKYIIADREPLMVAQSLLKARKRFFGNYDDWFSIMPKNYEQLLAYSCYQQVVLQHFYINQQMYADLKTLIAEQNYLTVFYSDFCSDKNAMMHKIKLLLDYGVERAEYRRNEVGERRTKTIPEAELLALDQYIQQLDWHDYKS